MSNINKIQEIMALAILLSQSGAKQVFADYSGHVDSFYVRVFEAGTQWDSMADQNAEFKADVRMGWQDDVDERLNGILMELESLMTEEVTA